MLKHLSFIFLLFSVPFAANFYCYKLSCNNKTEFDFNTANNLLDKIPIDIKAYIIEENNNTYGICLDLLKSKPKDKYNNLKIKKYMNILSKELIQKNIICKRKIISTNSTLNHIKKLKYENKILNGKNQTDFNNNTLTNSSNFVSLNSKVSNITITNSTFKTFLIKEQKRSSLNAALEKTQRNSTNKTLSPSFFAKKETSDINQAKNLDKEKQEINFYNKLEEKKKYKKEKTLENINLNNTFVIICNVTYEPCKNISLKLSKIKDTQLLALYKIEDYETLIYLLKNIDYKKLSNDVAYALADSYIKVGNLNKAKKILLYLLEKNYKKALPLLFDIYYSLNDCENLLKLYRKYKAYKYADKEKKKLLICSIKEKNEKLTFNLLKSINDPAIKKSLNNLKYKNIYVLDTSLGYEYNIERLSENFNNSPYLKLNFVLTRYNPFNYYMFILSTKYYTLSQVDSSNYIYLSFSKKKLKKDYSYILPSLDYMYVNKSSYFISLSIEFEKAFRKTIKISSKLPVIYYIQDKGASVKPSLGLNLKNIINLNINYEYPFYSERNPKLSSTLKVQYKKENKERKLTFIPSLTFNYNVENLNNIENQTRKTSLSLNLKLEKLYKKFKIYLGGGYEIGKSSQDEKVYDSFNIESGINIKF